MNRRQKTIASKNSRLRWSILGIFLLGAIALGIHAFGDSLLAGSVTTAGLSLAAAPLVVANSGRQVGYISGIQGVNAGGIATINLPTNRRYHRINFQIQSGGTPAAVAVNTVISSIKIIVNGIAIRDISPDNILKIAIANGYIPRKGELPIFFTEPYLNGPNVMEPSDNLSWDLVGQSSFQVQLGIKTGVTNPTVTGVYEYDYRRNTLPNGSLYLQPVAMHEFTLNLVSGRNTINTIPFDFPIRRFWFQGATAGHLTELEIDQDGNKVFEANLEGMYAIYRQYGFRFKDSDFDSRIFAAGTADSTLAEHTDLEARQYFDAAFISDPDGRWWKALKVGQELKLKITTDAAVAITVVAEVLPGAFAS